MSLLVEKTMEALIEVTAMEELRRMTAACIDGKKYVVRSREDLVKIPAKFLDGYRALMEELEQPAPEYLNMIALRWQEMGVTPLMKPMHDLREKLKAFAGRDMVLFGYDQDIYYILLYGQFRFGNEADLVPGTPKECHANAARMFKENPELRICTGYAMAEDGIWYQHSWCVRPDSRIIETTCRWNIYYGYTMTQDLAEKFALHNGEGVA